MTTRRTARERWRGAWRKTTRASGSSSGSGGAGSPRPSSRALSTSNPLIAVIDADLQHDERILPAMVAKLRAERLDMVIGSRHAADGGMGTLSRDRVTPSNAGRRLFTSSHARTSRIR